MTFSIRESNYFLLGCGLKNKFLNRLVDLRQFGIEIFKEKITLELVFQLSINDV